MKFRIETIDEKRLIGQRLRMSVARNRTGELWGQFAPRVREIPHRIGTNKISLQRYPTGYFETFDPNAEFEKWAAVEVESVSDLPSDLETLLLPGGTYAVFTYRGRSSDPAPFRYIYGEWLPNSAFELDDRPHFEVLGEKYRNDDPNSEEEIWIPIKPASSIVAQPRQTMSNDVKPHQNKDGRMFIFTAPSGAGKTTIVRHLLREFANLSFSVSATNRPPREGEIDGQDYYFLSTEKFRERVENGDFLEWEEVYPGRLYGTLRSEVERIWANGKHVVFDIEVKGATNLKRAYPERTLATFIKVPSLEALEQRLRDRGTESEESIRKRIARWEEELQYVNNFDRVLINDQLSDALAEAEGLVRGFLT